MAQETEKAQAGNLTGFYEIDKPVFAMLYKEIKQGIELNEMNLKAVSCIPIDSRGLGADDD